MLEPTPTRANRHLVVSGRSPRSALRRMAGHCRRAVISIFGRRHSLPVCHPTAGCAAYRCKPAHRPAWHVGEPRRYCDRQRLGRPCRLLRSRQQEPHDSRILPTPDGGHLRPGGTLRDHAHDRVLLREDSDRARGTPSSRQRRRELSTGFRQLDRGLRMGRARPRLGDEWHLHEGGSPREDASPQVGPEEAPFHRTRPSRRGAPRAPEVVTAGNGRRRVLVSAVNGRGISSVTKATRASATGRPALQALPRTDILHRRSDGAETRPTVWWGGPSLATYGCRRGWVMPNQKGLRSTRRKVYRRMLEESRLGETQLPRLRPRSNSVREVQADESQAGAGPGPDPPPSRTTQHVQTGGVHFSRRAIEAGPGSSAIGFDWRLDDRLVPLRRRQKMAVDPDGAPEVPPNPACSQCGQRGPAAHRPASRRPGTPTASSVVARRSSTPGNPRGAKTS